MDTRSKRWMPSTFAAVAICALIVFAPPAARADIPATEREVLDALYAQTGGPGWTSSTGWETDATLCSWHGITCDEGDTHVIGITLDNNHLTGTLPALAALTQLQTFDVGFNQLSGAIPALDGLANLQTFVLRENAFSGSIPPLAGLSMLQRFDVLDNALTGSAPDLAGLVALGDLELGGNRLTGPAPAPPPDDADEFTASLCPNFFDPRQTPESPTDIYWDIVIDGDWDEGCTAAPVVVNSAVPAPTLSTDVLLVLAGIVGLGGCLVLRRREASLRAVRTATDGARPVSSSR